MRKYLTEINLVGATMVYQEEDLCRWSLDWLFNNCDIVCILLDNYNKETENIVLEYKVNFPDKIRIIYSTEPVGEKTNLIQGHPKRRFKLRQNYIREQVIQEFYKMHKEKPIDLIIFMDSDETWINQFPEYLKEFWYNRSERYMMIGCIEPFENFNTIVYQKMSPHARVFKYDETMTAHPYIPRCRYYPYNNERGWKVRNLILHMCHFNERYRKFRQHCDNTPWLQESLDYPVWNLPKDVREMIVDEIADYQFRPHQLPSKYPPITLKEYIENNKLNIKT